MPVKTQVQVSRSSVAGARPAAGSQPVGSLYVNFPDKQLGVIDPAGNPVDLIPSGSAGDVSISTDAGNTTVLGTDGGVYTPMPTVADVGAAAVDHTHDFPVDSVNGQFGDVVLTAPDVGAATVDHDHLAADIADFGEAVDDRVGTLIQAGANVSINYDDTNNALVISSSGGGGSTPVISMDAGNQTRLGTDAGVFTPLPTPAAIGAAPTAHTHAIADVTGLQPALDGKAPTVHTHTAAQVTDFSEAVDDRVGALVKAGANMSVVYDDNANTLTLNATATPMKVSADAGNQSKLGTDAGIFTPLPTPAAIGAAPATHTHAIADVTGLQPALDGKAPTVHTHTAAQITDFAEAVDDRAAALIKAGANTTVTYDDVANTLTISASGGTAPVTSVNSKTGAVVLTATDVGAAATAHIHVIADVTGLQTALDGKAPVTHTHTTAQVTGLDAALAAKQPLDADLTAIAGLTGTSGILKKTAADTWTLDTASYALATHTHTSAQITDFAEAVDDRVGALVKAGANTTVTYDDVANTLTIGAVATAMKVSTDAGNQSTLGTDGGVYTPVPRVISANDTLPALRITQLGTGNALLVEDSTNPDATPFVITDVGTIISGHTLPIDTDGYTGLPTSVRLQLHGVSSTASTLGNTLWNNSGVPVQMIMSKSRSAAIGAYSPVQSGDGLGALVFAGDDGSAFVTAASIIGMSDGTPGASDMPGRLVFATTADGASAPSERMRIASDGKVGIGTNAAGARLHVAENAATPAIIITQTGAGDALVVEDSTSPDATPTIITQAGQIVSGHTTTVNTDNSYGGQITPRVQTHGTITDNAALGATLWTGSGAGSQVALSKSRGATIGTNVIVQSGDDIGAVAFNGDDGASFIVAAAISAAVDGTPGTNDMPGRLVLSTTADGAAVPTERLRINSSGAIGLAGANFGTDGQVLTSKGAALPPVWASTNSHTHTASQITDFSEAVDDRVGALIKAGTNTTVTYDDVANTLTISASGGTAPVTSVNSKTGAVVLAAADVGAAPTTHTHTSSQITDFAESVDDRVGALVKAGTNTTVTYDDVANTLTVSAATTRVIDVNDATPGLRITQQGTGDPLVVEDAASPDNSPFRVNVDGRVLIGHTQSIPTAFPMGASGEPQLQVHIPASGLYSWWAVDNSTASLTLNRSYSGQVGVHAAVPDGVILGAVSFNGSDGTAFTRSAIVRAVRDGAVGAAGVPAKLEFYTFDGVATAPNPRLVINAKGALGFGNATTNYGTAGQALLSGGSTGQPTWGANLYVMEEDLAALKQKALDVEKALTDAVTNLATTLEAAETRISSLKGLLTKANNKITDLENRLTSVETGLGITGGV